MPLVSVDPNTLDVLKVKLKQVICVFSLLLELKSYLLLPGLLMVKQSIALDLELNLSYFMQSLSLVVNGCRHLLLAVETHAILVAQGFSHA